MAEQPIKVTILRVADPSGVIPPAHGERECFQRFPSLRAIESDLDAGTQYRNSPEETPQESYTALGSANSKVGLEPEFLPFELHCHR
jgi:hypothetical protein